VLKTEILRQKFVTTDSQQIWHGELKQTEMRNAFPQFPHVWTNNLEHTPTGSAKCRH